MSKPKKCRFIILDLDVYLANNHLRERFFSHVDMPADVTACWFWNGAKNENGYGRIQLGGRGSPVACAHRVAYVLVRGPIPKDRELDHRCEVRHCINPWHTKPETGERNRSYRHKRFSLERYAERPVAA
jgi:hypothetical protein